MRLAPTAVRIELKEVCETQTMGMQMEYINCNFATLRSV